MRRPIQKPIRKARVVGAAKRRPRPTANRVKAPVDARVKYRPKKHVVRDQPEARESDLAVAEKALVTLNARLLVYSKRVDAIDKDIGLSSSLSKQPSLSTGLLAHDLMLGGHGYIPGFNVNWGAEQSAKTTDAITTLGESLRMPIAVRKLFDAEGTTDRRYAGNIMHTDNFDKVFGSRTSKGEWITPPLCRYHDSPILEEVFVDIHRMAKMMPDKVFRPEIGEHGEWFLVFERTKVKMALMKEMQLTPDKTLFSKTGKYWCSVGDDQSPQGLIIIDSLPALLSRTLDEESVAQKGLASDSRFLGPYLKLVRGKLRPKGIILLAVNQLRSNPGARAGQSPIYEPCGNVVKLASDSRTLFTSRVPMDGFPKCKENGGLCEEPSFEYPGGKDLYAFKGMTNYKNKYGTPGRKTSARVWIKDGDGNPRGFDPAYDVYRFLDDIGVIHGPIHDSRRGFHIDLKPVREVEWKWPVFKASIIAEDSGDKKLWARAREMGAPNFKLRDFCKKLLKSGRAEELMVIAARRQREKVVEVDLEAEDEE